MARQARSSAGSPTWGSMGAVTPVLAGAVPNGLMAAFEVGQAIEDQVGQAIAGRPTKQGVVEALKVALTYPPVRNAILGRLLPKSIPLPSANPLIGGGLRQAMRQSSLPAPAR